MSLRPPQASEASWNPAGDTVELDLLVQASTGGVYGRVLMPDGGSRLGQTRSQPHVLRRYDDGSVSGLEGQYALPTVVPEGGFRLEVSTGAVNCAEGEADCLMPTGALVLCAGKL